MEHLDTVASRRRLPAVCLVIAAIAAACGPGRADDEFTFFGDARARYDGRDRSDALYRARGRIRVRPGIDGRQYDGLVDWRIRLATEPADPVSRNLTLLGRDGGEHNSIGFDTIQMNFHPLDNLVVSAGLMPVQSAWSASEMIFDGDLTAPGVFLRWRPGAALGPVDHLDLRVGAYTAYALFGRHSAPFMVAGQVRGDVGPVTLTAGVFHFDGFGAVNYRTAEVSQFTNNFVNLDTDGDGVADRRNIVGPRLTVLRGRIEYPFELFGLPIEAGFEYIHNTAASLAKAGYEVRLDFPEVPYGSAYALWRDVGQDATYSPWADSDLGEGTGNRSCLEVGYSAPVCDWLAFEASYYHFDRYQPLNGAGARDTDRLFIDLIAKWKL